MSVEISIFNLKQQKTTKTTKNNKKQQKIQQKQQKKECKNEANVCNPTKNNKNNKKKIVVFKEERERSFGTRAKFEKKKFTQYNYFYIQKKKYLKFQKFKKIFFLFFFSKIKKNIKI